MVTKIWKVKKTEEWRNVLYRNAYMCV